MLGIFQPVHGSAPDIVGRGVANPVAMILSLAMLLRYSLCLPDVADAIEAMVKKVLEGHSGGPAPLRTPDIGGDASTKDFGACQPQRPSPRPMFLCRHCRSPASHAILQMSGRSRACDAAVQCSKLRLVYKPTARLSVGQSELCSQNRRKCPSEADLRSRADGVSYSTTSPWCRTRMRS